MKLEELLRSIDAEVSGTLSTGLKVEITQTTTVPDLDDPALTYSDPAAGRIRCKRLESCVLYVDIRNSAQISVDKKPMTLSRLYSSFVRAMIRSARQYGGHVRNIIGDRVMVVYDQENCYFNAIKTAVLMNTVSRHIINKHSGGVKFKVGIGIDFGSMLVTKAGVPRQSSEREFYRSLVWLGRPANVASRLTDLANKTKWWSVAGIKEGLYYPFTQQWIWSDRTYEQFIDRFEKPYGPILRHKDPYFHSYSKTTLGPYFSSAPAILMTDAVYLGFRRDHPQDVTIQKKLWKKRSVPIAEYSGQVWGGDVHFGAGAEL